MLRSGYSTRIRFFTDSDEEVEITWYRAQPGAPMFPFYTPFASGNWASSRVEWPGLGEVLGAPRPWANGRTPLAPLGIQFCGTADQWRNGFPRPTGPPLLYTNQGLPLCVYPAPTHPVGFGGGGAGNGRAGFNHVWTFIASGGGAGDGGAAFEFTHVVIASGGGAGNGAAGFVHVLIASGGGAGNGTSEFNPMDTHACSACSGGLAADNVQITVSGVTNGTCSDCSNVNGTRTLATISACAWETATFTLCGGAAAKFHLSVTLFGVTLTLFSGDGISVVGQWSSMSSWDCVSDKSVPKVTDVGQCNGLPANVTLHPI